MGGGNAFLWHITSPASYMSKKKDPEVAALKSYHDFRPSFSQKIALFPDWSFQGLILRSIFEAYLWWWMFDHMHVPRLHMIYCISTRWNTLQSWYYSTCPITLGSSDTVLIIERMLKCSFKYRFTYRKMPPHLPSRRRTETSRSIRNHFIPQSICFV